MSTKHRILVVDDDPSIRQLLKASFEGSSYDLIEAGTLNSALTLCREFSPDLVILDLGLPDGDGKIFIKRFRESNTNPIIVLTARGEEVSKIEALDAGANDYVTKPFGPAELTARVRAALRWLRRDVAVTVFDSKGLRVDLSSHEVIKDGVLIHLTPTEFQLLAILLKHQGSVVTHRQLLTEVWGVRHVGQNHYLRIYMKALRHKLENEPTRPEFILTESGIGYRFAS